MPIKKVLLLSAYDAMSHRCWRRGLVKAFPEYAWSVLTLPARHFSWRIRGNALTWAFSERSALSRPCDLVITTSMSDLATLRGLVPSLGRRPSLVYFHENQFAYPQRAGSSPCIEAKMVTLYTALAAERVVFNSEFNRNTFLDGVEALLEKIPDNVPGGLVEKLRARSGVLPVPLDDTWFTSGQVRSREGPFTLLWNHRWEFDKAPDRLFAALLLLKDHGIDFRIHVIGQQFRSRPRVFEEMHSNLGAHIESWGMVTDPDAYKDILRRSHVVISTALHDFQGLAVLEAVVCGCIPVVPDRLAYREFFGEEFLYASWLHDPGREAEALCGKLIWLAEQYHQGKLILPPDISYLSWRQQKARYAAMLENARIQNRT